jgi:hypothetical protein
MQSRERKTPVPARPAMDPEKPLPAPQRTQPACSLNWKPSRGKKKRVPEEGGCRTAYCLCYDNIFCEGCAMITYIKLLLSFAFRIKLRHTPQRMYVYASTHNIKSISKRLTVIYVKFRDLKTS